MTEELKNTIKKELLELPQEGQDAINAFDWIKVTEEMGKKYSLLDSELNDFQLETLLVLIGVTDPEFYAVNIENHVDTTKDQAEAMATEAFAKIFTPIKNVLEETAKRNPKNKNPDWQQSIEFILSGGDYSSFITKRDAIIK